MTTHKPTRMQKHGVVGLPQTLYFTFHPSGLLTGHCGSTEIEAIKSLRPSSGGVWDGMKKRGFTVRLCEVRNQ